MEELRAIMEECRAGEPKQRDGTPGTKTRQGTLDVFGVKVPKALVWADLPKNRRRDAGMTERVRHMRLVRAETVIR
jgi:hypothetical protein